MEGKMTEKEMTNELLKLVDRGFVPFKIYSIETTTINGFPDIYFTGNGKGGLIELKIADKIKKDNYCDHLTVRYERFQRNILLQHQEYNPYTFLLVHVKQTKINYLFDVFTERLDIDKSLAAGSLEHILQHLHRRTLS
jgi:hypothetical protein